MYDIGKIKLIIWDLDETLWTGTLSEGDVVLSEETKRFIKDAADMGVVHSICSKNDFDEAKKKLTDLDIWDYFVFPSIDWNPKGTRIKTILEKMALRPANVLFTDDNIQNLKEAEFFAPGIMTAEPHELKPLYEAYASAEKKDKAHKRLKQYRILETKDSVKGQFNSNSEFLMSCNIKVEMIPDCIGELDRIHELIMRSNQLNYTKFRQPKDELEKLLKDESVTKGIVKARDRFGDYGIVGFYAVKDKKTVHFLFSCRTLGMMIEQYVYKKLGCPELEVIGDVAAKLNDSDMPEWINKSDGGAAEEKKTLGKKVLFKGPCDLLQMFTFIKKSDKTATEFAYTNDDGVFVEGHNYSSVIASAVTETKENKERALKNFKWLDKGMLETSIGKEEYDFIFLSLLGDFNLGLYRHKETGVNIALCEGFYPLTDVKNFEGYIKGSIYNSNIKFTRDDLTRFSEEFEFIDNSEGQETLKALDKLERSIGKNTRLVLITGSEKPCGKDKRESYKNRHLVHKKVNQKINAWADGKENVSVINLGKYVSSEKDYNDSINHFTKEVYYRLAEDTVKIINQGGVALKMKGAGAVTVQKAKDAVKKLLGRQ